MTDVTERSSIFARWSILAGFHLIEPEQKIWLDLFEGVQQTCCVFATVPAVHAASAGANASADGADGAGAGGARRTV